MKSWNCQTNRSHQTAVLLTFFLYAIGGVKYRGSWIGGPNLNFIQIDAAVMSWPDGGSSFAGMSLDAKKTLEQSLPWHPDMLSGWLVGSSFCGTHHGGYDLASLRLAQNSTTSPEGPVVTASGSFQRHSNRLFQWCALWRGCRSAHQWCDLRTLWSSKDDDRLALCKKGAPVVDLSRQPCILVNWGCVRGT
jgi:hypothetical protein